MKKITYHKEQIEKRKGTWVAGEVDIVLEESIDSNNQL